MILFILVFLLPSPKHRCWLTIITMWFVTFSHNFSLPCETQYSLAHMVLAQLQFLHCNSSCWWCQCSFFALTPEHPFVDEPLTATPTLVVTLSSARILSSCEPNNSCCNTVIMNVVQGRQYTFGFGCYIFDLKWRLLCSDVFCKSHSRYSVDRL